MKEIKICWCCGKSTMVKIAKGLFEFYQCENCGATVAPTLRVPPLPKRSPRKPKYGR